MKISDIKRFIKNRSVIYNLSIVISITIGIGLIALMKLFVIEATAVYLPKENAYGYPFNFGFRWSTILGMIAIILIQSSMYAMVSFRKKYKIVTWIFGIWLQCAIVFNDVFISSRIYSFLYFRDNGFESISEVIDSKWDYMNNISWSVIGIIGLMYFSKWLGVNFRKNERRTKPILNILMLILVVCGIFCLASVSCSNIWYFGICIIFDLMAWIALSILERTVPYRYFFLYNNSSREQALPF